MSFTKPCDIYDNISDTIYGTRKTIASEEVLKMPLAITILRQKVHLSIKMLRKLLYILAYQIHNDIRLKTEVISIHQKKNYMLGKYVRKIYELSKQTEIFLK